MSYAGSTSRFKIPFWDTGEVSSGIWNECISQQIEWLLEQLQSLASGGLYDGTLFDGFIVSAGAGLSINVAAGYGIVDGIPIYASGITAKSGLADSSTLYIYLKLAATSPQDRTFTVEASVSGPPMADAIYIAKVITSGGSVSSVDNNPTGRTPRLRVPGIPQLRVVAPAGAAYTDPEAAIEGAPAGAVILIMPGTYTVTGTITLPNNNISIIGVNRDGCVLNFTAADANHCIDLNGKDGIRIRCLSITAVAGKTGSGVYGAGSTDALIYDVYINGAGLAFGIYLVGNSHRAIIEECYIAGSPAQAIALASSNYPMVVNNVIDSSKTNGIGINFDTCSFGAVMGNTVRLSGTSSQSGIINMGSDLAIVANNVIAVTPAGSYGLIWMRATTASGARLTANNNIIASAGAAAIGIQVQTTDPYNLDDCIISGNVVSAAATGITIVDSRVRYALIHGNNVRGCTAGISDSGTSTTSADNITP